MRRNSSYNSDPWDASSSNRPPSDINASNLTIAENSAIGTVIGEFNATDPDRRWKLSQDFVRNQMVGHHLYGDSDSGVSLI